MLAISSIAAWSLAARFCSCARERSAFCSGESRWRSGVTLVSQLLFSLGMDAQLAAVDVRDRVLSR
jgi:hypothetical protein